MKRDPTQLTSSINALCLLGAICLLLLPASSLCSDEYMSDSRAEQLITIQRLLFNDRFDLAEAAAREVVESSPNLPDGYFSVAAVLLGRMMDREQSDRKEQFHALLDTVENISEQIGDTASGRTAAWMYLYTGHARAYRSLFESRFGSFVPSVRLGIAARKEYSKGVKLDSSLYDLYLGLGTYHYWKSAKAGFLRWLGIFKNEIDKGITELYLAADSSIISRESARSSLVWVWLDRKQYDSTVIICEELLAVYPDGNVWLWPLAEALMELCQYRRALETYQLLRSRLQIEPGNYCNLIECDYRTYRCLKKLNSINEARQVAREVDAYLDSVPRSTQKKYRSQIDLLKRVARL